MTDFALEISDLVRKAMAVNSAPGMVIGMSVDSKVVYQQG